VVPAEPRREGFTKRPKVLGVELGESDDECAKEEEKEEARRFLFKQDMVLQDKSIHVTIFENDF
jgi:hypothetical protein